MRDPGMGGLAVLFVCIMKESSMKYAMTGASGFVGTALQRAFGACVRIGRDDDSDTLRQKLEGVDVVINLAGAPILSRWTESYQKILMDSRIGTTRRLVEEVNRSEVGHLISTSAIGIYPDDQACDEECTEASKDFLGELAQRWEEEARACTKLTTILRLGVVLGKEGGALAKMLPPFKLGLGGPVGDGSMMTSWIDLDDLVSIYRFVIDEKLEGVFNAVAPKPVSNAVFTKALGKVLHRPTIFPVPVMVLRLMYGDGASVLTGSKEIYPKALMEAGFTFDYAEIGASLEHLLQ